jgi:hypothetical protein
MIGTGGGGNSSGGSGPDIESLKNFAKKSDL